MLAASRDGVSVNLTQISPLGWPLSRTLCLIGEGCGRQARRQSGRWGQAFLILKSIMLWHFTEEDAYRVVINREIQIKTTMRHDHTLTKIAHIKRRERASVGETTGGSVN